MQRWKSKQVIDFFVSVPVLGVKCQRSFFLLNRSLTQNARPSLMSVFMWHIMCHARHFCDMQSSLTGICKFYQACGTTRPFSNSQTSNNLETTFNCFGQRRSLYKAQQAWEPKSSQQPDFSGLFEKSVEQVDFHKMSITEKSEKTPDLAAPAGDLLKTFRSHLMGAQLRVSAKCRYNGNSSLILLTYCTRNTV